eukprot:g1929.t1
MGLARFGVTVGAEDKENPKKSSFKYKDLERVAGSSTATIFAEGVAKTQPKKVDVAYIQQAYSGVVMMRWNRCGTVRKSLDSLLMLEPLALHWTLEKVLRGAYLSSQDLNYIADAPSSHKEAMIVAYFLALLMRPVDAFHATQLAAHPVRLSKVSDIVEQELDYVRNMLLVPDLIENEIFVLTGWDLEEAENSVCRELVDFLRRRALWGTVVESDVASDRLGFEGVKAGNNSQAEFMHDITAVKLSNVDKSKAEALKALEPLLQLFEQQKIYPSRKMQRTDPGAICFVSLRRVLGGLQTAEKLRLLDAFDEVPLEWSTEGVERGMCEIIAARDHPAEEMAEVQRLMEAEHSRGHDQHASVQEAAAKARSGYRGGYGIYLQKYAGKQTRIPAEQREFSSWTNLCLTDPDAAAAMVGEARLQRSQKINDADLQQQSFWAANQTRRKHYIAPKLQVARVKQQAVTIQQKYWDLIYSEAKDYYYGTSSELRLTPNNFRTALANNMTPREARATMPRPEGFKFYEAALQEAKILWQADQSKKAEDFSL